jgi:CheY-like chemotaxis protein
MARVLVVDDDAQVHRLLRVNFELEGYQVDSAFDGPEALAAISKRRPDVLVCDVMMPGLDGVEVVRRLRGDPKTADLPVVLVSAKAQKGDAAAGKEAGADAYVTKPFDPQELLDTVSSLLEGR